MAKCSPLFFILGLENLIQQMDCFFGLVRVIPFNLGLARQRVFDFVYSKREKFNFKSTLNAKVANQAY